jgi:RNA polymerase sigma-70 factor (ECF subfamily)
MERADAVRQAMNALPQAQREALYLFGFEGLSLSDVAGILGIEVNAVKARLYRGREQLKLLLAPLQTAAKETP